MTSRRVLPLITLSATVACAPAVPKSDGSSEVNLLEAFVKANYSAFDNLETLAAGSGMDLVSDQAADWPEPGEATVTFGSSEIDVGFTVDRTDYTRVSRVWTVDLDLLPLMAGGEAFEGDLSGTWNYWEEVEGDPASSWVELSLSGQVAHSGTDGPQPTNLFATVNGLGEIWDADVIFGEDTYLKEP